MKTCVKFVVAVVAGLFSSAPAGAAVLTPTGVTASSYYSNTGTTRLPIHTIDSSGLTPSSPWDLHTDIETPSGPFSDTMWLSNEAGLPTITWDLGALHVLTGFHLWNYNETGLSARGVQTADILVSSDNSTYIPVTITAASFTQAPGASGYAGEDYAFTSMLFDVQWIRFENITKFPAGDFQGALSEIRFVSRVPEPSSMILAAGASLALYGFSRRRHR